MCVCYTRSRSSCSQDCALPECAGEQERLLWWQHCKFVVQESAVDTEVLVTMCDANARVGSVQSSWIGPMRPEKENQHGRQLHQMLEEFDQIASNTFFSQGGSSWTSSTGAQAKIDYVAIPRQWASLVVVGTHGEIVLWRLHGPQNCLCESEDACAWCKDRSFEEAPGV